VKRLIVIQGPTASGKTALAIALAKKFHTEIVSADSRQFYNEMEIGTAKPSKEELAIVPHHFINSDSIQKLVTVGEYEIRAMEKLTQLFLNHDNVIMVGGSGQFIDAVVLGLDPIPTDLAIREELIRRQKNGEMESLARELVLLDKTAEKTIDLKNPVRVIRALEVFKITGKPLSSLQSQTPKQRPFETVRFAINLPREILYERINFRVEQMMEKGLLEEAKSLFSLRHLKALQTVGYQELFPFFEGKAALKSAVELIQQNSRHYAKRQMTWLRRTKDLNWLQGQNLEEQLQEILNFLP